MLLGDFFTINDTREEGDKTPLYPGLNPDHAIFRGISLTCLLYRESA
jgi:hypothetical protein